MRSLSPARLASYRKPFGALLETFVLAELLKLASWNDERLDFFHFRDRYDNEVDIVIEDPSGHVVGTAPVGTFPANAFGLFDMIGNVSEWTQDCYVMRYLSSDEPVKHEGECVRVTRGGSWDSESQFSTVSRRLWNTRSFRERFLGFRLAADP
jgi:formylglycine-generating enzyme required for sulfatase activity